MESPLELMRYRHALSLEPQGHGSVKYFKVVRQDWEGAVGKSGEQTHHP